MSRPCDAQAARRQAHQLALAYFAGTHRARVLNALIQAGDDGLTADELEVVLSMSGNSVRPRLQELAKPGGVRRTDRSRRTRSGAFALVWVAVEGQP